MNLKGNLSVSEFNDNLISTQNMNVALRAIVDHIDPCIYIKNKTGHYTFVNQSVERLFGSTCEDILGKDDYYFFNFKDSKDALINDRLVIDLGKTIDCEEITTIKSTGEQRVYRSIKKPIYNDHGEIIGLYGISSDITKCKQIEKELQIAAIAFDSQEGIFITNDKGEILKVNHAFTKITGYTADEVIGKTMFLNPPGNYDADFYEKLLESTRLDGSWHGEISNHYKNGEVSPGYMTISSVINPQGLLTNYVATLTDISEYKKAQQMQLAAEISLRNTLVREVHHRIKNNLQGVSGILHNFSVQQPEFIVPVKKAISQVQTIAVIHGLQGRSSRSKVRLCELTREIADNNVALWHIPVLVDIPSHWLPCLIAESEAVPIALVLNELITNAIKHGHNEKVSITISHEPLPEMIRLIITNSGHISPELNLSDISVTSTGLQLILSLLPKKGAHLTWKQHGDTVAFQLELGYPVVTLELEEMETR
jgi:PAS domain S-box-containing protein